MKTAKAAIICLCLCQKLLLAFLLTPSFLKKFQKSRLYNQLEQNKLIDTLDNLGLMLDIKTINKLRGSGNESRQNN